MQQSAVEPDLTVRDCLDLYAGYYPAPRDVHELIELVGLGEKAAVLGSQLSGGQRRRLDVALALVGDPELIFLDEPTTGFDPSARRAAWEMIAGLQALGKTIFLTTHDMAEAEYLADRLCVLAEGQIVAQGTPSDLGGRACAPSEISFTLPPDTLAGDLPDEVVVTITGQTHRRIELRSHTPLETLESLARWARHEGYALADLEVHQPTLEEIYLQLTAGSQ